MKLDQPWLMKLGGLGIATWIRRWMSTIEYQAAFYDQTTNPAHIDFTGPAIFVMWHEYLLSPIYLWGHCNISLLISQHRDASWLGHAAYNLGYDLVRGSTSRGSTTALRRLFRKSREMNVSITPDGPRGPRRQLAQGPIYLSSRLQIPLVALGIGYDRCWRFNSWDRFVIPKLYGRCRLIASPDLQIPSALNRDGIEHYRCHVEKLLNRLTLEAEAWAQSGTRKQEQFALLRKPAPLAKRRFDRGNHQRAISWSKTMQNVKLDS